REKPCVIAHMPAHHAAIGNVTERHTTCEIGPLRLGLLSCHDVRNRRSLSPYEAAPRRVGHEQTTNRFDLVRFQSAAESRRARLAPRPSSLAVLSANGVRSPFRPFRHRPASAGGGAASSRLLPH